MDAITLFGIAKLARDRSANRARMPEGDPQERLGAQRALKQLAEDLEVMAGFVKGGGDLRTE